MSNHILIADDEETMREALADVLREEGFGVSTCSSGDEAARILGTTDIAILLTDLRMPGLDGMELLRRLPELNPRTVAVVVTAYGTVSSAVEAMKLGARDYIVKPFLFDDVIFKLRRLLELRSLAEENRALRQEIDDRYDLARIVCASPAMGRVMQLIGKVSRTTASVLLEGETGTGKELLARAIHRGRESGRFVPVNCGAIPSNLIESELFGHRKGAFSGATRDKEGLVEAAHGGTLFLDELSSLPPEAQAALLRVTEEKAVRRVGDTVMRRIDFRLIAATNRPLAELVERGLFREDLLYRLNAVTIAVPPLRERREDLPLLVEHFIAKYRRELGASCPGITPPALRALAGRPWKGNVRELENVIERAVIFAETRPIDLGDLPLPFGVEEPAEADAGDLREAIAAFEKQHIARVLESCRGDKNEAARCLGIGVSSLYRKLEEHAIPRGGGPPATGAPRSHG